MPGAGAVVFYASNDDFLCIRDAVIAIVSEPIPFLCRDRHARVCVSNHNTFPGVHREPDSTMQCCCFDDWRWSMHTADAGEHRSSTRHKTQCFPKNIIHLLQLMVFASQPRERLFRCFVRLYTANLASGKSLCQPPVVYSLHRNAKPLTHCAHSDFIGQFQYIRRIVCIVFSSHL